MADSQGRTTSRHGRGDGLLIELGAKPLLQESVHFLWCRPFGLHQVRRKIERVGALCLGKWISQWYLGVMYSCHPAASHASMKSLVLPLRVAGDAWPETPASMHHIRSHMRTKAAHAARATPLGKMIFITN
eukprot:1253503-Pyramimonas_sp.AAC.1